MRIAHFGTFDVENYGDLLFPLILERRLRSLGIVDAKRGDEVVHVSPVGGGPVFGDCVTTVSTEAADAMDFDAIVVGGGHIVHAQAPDVPPYGGRGETQLYAYSDLWYGATRLGCALGVPVVWNAPGVPGGFSPNVSQLAAWAVAASDYVAVRDERSRSFLVEAGTSGAIEIAPDTVLEVDGLFTPDELDRATEQAFAVRGMTKPERTIAFHFNSRYLTETLEETARRIDTLCEAQGATAVLLALGRCHGDGELQAQLGAKMTTPRLVIEQPASLREVIGLIRDASFYIGSSLHGAVTSFAFGRPAWIVAREAEGGHAKFSGYLTRHLGLDRDQVLFESWSDAFERLESGPPRTTANREVVAATQAQLDRHWHRIDRALRSPRTVVEPAKQRAREAYARLQHQHWERAVRNVAVLLDQASAASGFRETAQRNARRFRELDRHYRALKQSRSPSPPSG